MKKVFTLLLASALFSSMAWADYSVTAYKGNSTPVTMTLASAADWQAVLDVTPNAVAILDYSADNETFAATTKNIILKTTITRGSKNYYSYTCPNLVLTDLCNWGNGNATTAAATDFYSPVDFTATTGSYSRSLRGDYNSVCVPFEITDGMFGSHEILAYSSYDDVSNDVKFNYQDAVSAGIGVIIKLAAAKNWVVNFNETDIKGTPVTGPAFKGVFQTTSAYACSWYSVNTMEEETFSPLADKLYPFRACFQLTGNVHNTAPRLVILNEQDATNLDELNANAEDVKFMENGKLVIRHNGQVFNAAGKIVK